MITRVLLGAAAALVFLLLATANAGGYRYGVSDQAFYVPALSKAIDPTLFPRDGALLAVQTRVWAGDDAIAAVSRIVPVDLPTLAWMGYLAGMLLLAGGMAFLVRGLGGSWWAIGAALALETLRHQIPETGANSLEGYFHPRMIAFAMGLWALGFVLRRRYATAFAIAIVAAVVHPTTALWFGAAIVAAAAWQLDRRILWVLAMVALGGAFWFGIKGVRMDAAWLAVVAGKDYLFPLSWPLWAWIVNLAYPVVLWIIYRGRRDRGAARPGEGALVIGLLTLIAGFALSLPLTGIHVAAVIQAQVTRVLWLLDAAVVAYLACWLMDDVVRRSVRLRSVAFGLIVIAASARGYYVQVIEPGRPLIARTLPPSEWTDAMTFIRSQPARWNVLADPEHAWKYGSSVRVAALRDTVIEVIKDSAMAIYNRPIAVQVGDRAMALGGFASFTPEQLVGAGARYDADVLVLENDRRLRLPVLYENPRFTVYKLR